MGLIKKWQAVNIFAKVAVILLAVANLLNWLAFCMSEWGLYDTSASKNDEIGYGVWVRCGKQSTPDCQDLDGWRLSWYGAFQCFMVFGFVAVNLSFLLIVLLVFVDQCGGKKDLNMVCFISCIVAAVCYFIAIVIFGVRFDETYDVGWDEEEYYSSFYIAIVVLLMMIVAAILVFLAGRSSAGNKVSEGSSGGKSSEEKEAERRQKREEQERKKEENRKRKEEEAQRKREEQERKKEEQRRKKEENEREKENKKKRGKLANQEDPPALPSGEA